MLDAGLQSLLALHLQHTIPHIQSFAVLQVAGFAQPGPAARWSKCSHHDSCICCSLSPLENRIHALMEAQQAVTQRLSSSQSDTEPLHHCLELCLLLDGNLSA